jgi:c-di-GMP-binding flagellar brake protein YcgR
MAVRLKVVFEVKGKTAKNEIFYGKMIDLSTGGFLLEVEKSLSIGDILYCFFSLSKAEPLMFASGELVREAKSEKKNTHLYGLEFVNIRSDERKRIAEFIFGYSGEPEGDKDSPADLSLHPDGPEQL